MRLAALALTCALAAPAADMLEGRVWERAGRERRPLAKALVTVVQEGRNAGPSMARSDSEGRWRLAAPLRGRYAVSASRPGYFVMQADGAGSSSILVDCSISCGPVEFELGRGAAVQGVVEDEQGQPLENTVVQLRLVGEEPEPEGTSDGRRFGPRGGFDQPPSRRHEDRTNDLGRFRIAGLRPGVYRVEAQHNGRSTAARFEQSQPLTLELVAGLEKEVRMLLQQASAAGVAVSGAAIGLDLNRPGRHLLSLQPAAGGPSRGRGYGRLMTTLGDDGAFELSGLLPGRYFVSYSYVPERTQAQVALLGPLDVQRNMHGLTLSPVSSVRVAGRFELETGEEIRGAGAMFIPNDGAPPAQVYARGPDPGFHQEALYPGTYRIVARSRDLFLSGVRIGDRDVDPAAVPIHSDVDDLALVLSGRFARVEGRLHPPETRYTVTLFSADGQDSRPTDQNGGFVFDRLVPGDYTVCARPLGAPRASPCVVERQFAAEPDASIELELSLP